MSNPACTASVWGHNEITNAYRTLSIAHLAVTPANRTRCERRGCVRPTWAALAPRAASESRSYILRPGGPAPVDMRLFSPALLSQAYRARHRALARLSPGLHTSRIQNVKSEARAEEGILAQSSENLI